MFQPASPDIARRFDGEMRASLAASLEHIHAAAAAQVGCADLDISRVLSEIRHHRLKPGVYGRYFDLVFALQGERHDEAGRLMREIAASVPDNPRFAVVPLSDEALNGDRERYARLVNLEARATSGAAAPDAETFAAFDAHVRNAFRLLDSADRLLADEMRELIVQVVGASPSKSGGTPGFGGASSMMLWGAVFLNTARFPTGLDVLEGLVHEAAHQLLFGMSIGEPLVLNPIEERYESPLRPDPRPMDGVFHATFVCARVHYGYDRLRADGSADFSPADRELIAERLKEQRELFFSGLDTVQKHARLTATGERAMSGAIDYMTHA